MDFEIDEARMPDDLFKDPHTRPLALALSQLSPDELSLWWDVVRPLRTIWLTEKARYEDLVSSRSIAEGVLISHTTYDAENDLRKWLKAFAINTVRLKKKSSGIDFKQFVSKKGGLQLIAAGLSFMQILAISELLGVQLDSLELSDIPLALMAIIAALSLTFGSKEALVRWVKATKGHNDMKRSLQPFWQRLAKGESLIWASLVLVVMEMAFAAPGLISLLPPRQAGEFLPQLTAYCASGLAAFVNVLLAYGIAFEELAFEEKFQLRIEVENPEVVVDSFNVDLETAQMIRANYDKEIKHQGCVLFYAEKRYKKAFVRWQKQVKRVVRSRAFRRQLQQKS